MGTRLSRKKDHADMGQDLTNAFQALNRDAQVNHIDTSLNLMSGVLTSQDKARLQATLNSLSTVRGITVRVSDLSSDCMTFTMGSNEQVARIKSKIDEEAGTPRTRIRLYKEGDMACDLPDERLLVDLIGDADDLDLVMMVIAELELVRLEEDKPAWTCDTGQYRSSEWPGYPATHSLVTSTVPADAAGGHPAGSWGHKQRWASISGSFRDGRPVSETWIVYDLQREHAVGRVRVINYWSAGDSWSTKALELQAAEALGGPWRTAKAVADIPRCSAQRCFEVDLVEDPVTSRFWRLQFTENYGGSCVGVYGIDFWVFQ